MSLNPNEHEREDLIPLSEEKMDKALLKTIDKLNEIGKAVIIKKIALVWGVFLLMVFTLISTVKIAFSIWP